jgi:hypothetical protein
LTSSARDRSRADIDSIQTLAPARRSTATPDRTASRVRFFPFLRSRSTSLRFLALALVFMYLPDRLSFRTLGNERLPVQMLREPRRMWPVGFREPVARAAHLVLQKTGFLLACGLLWRPGGGLECRLGFNADSPDESSSAVTLDPCSLGLIRSVDRHNERLGCTRYC